MDERRKKESNLYPLKIRVTIDRRHKEFNLDIKIEKRYWDHKRQRVKPSHPNSKLIQFKISKKLIELQEVFLSIENNGKALSIWDISNSALNQKKNITFISFAKEHIQQQYEAGRIGNSIAYNCAVNKLEKFIGKKEIKFEDINYRFIEEFTSYMIKEGLKPNGIASYLRQIRALFNKAIKMELVQIKYYPFIKYKIKPEKTINKTLTLEETQSFAKIELASKNLKVYQSLFLLSFCLIGINFADLLTLSKQNLTDGRIIFNRRKTHKVYSIKLHNKAINLINYLINVKSNKGSYLFPFVNSNSSLLQQKNDIALVVHATNENLKIIGKMLNIDKPVSTYYARYSWANIAKLLGYSKDLIAEALGHEYGNSITGIYLDNYDKDLIDNMNEKVINAVFENED